MVWIQSFPSPSPLHGPLPWRGEGACVLFGERTKGGPFFLFYLLLLFSMPLLPSLFFIFCILYPILAPYDRGCCGAFLRITHSLTHGFCLEYRTFRTHPVSVLGPKREILLPTRYHVIAVSAPRNFFFYVCSDTTDCFYL